MNQLSKRLNFVLIVFALVFSIIAIKAFYLQVLNRGKLLTYYKFQAERNSIIYPYRGGIVDRNGNVLAMNIASYDLFVHPGEIENALKKAKKIEKIIPELTSEKIRKALQGRTTFSYLARKVELSEQQIENLIQLGVHTQRNIKRFYPNGSLLAQVLGSVGQDNIGLAGLEYTYDEQLKGPPLEVSFLRDAKGRAIKYSQELKKKKVPDLVLTIDKNIQGVAEQYLAQAVEEHGALRGGIGVMDANTGEIWALANYPSFDANKPVTAENLHLKKLALITDPFEPGSIFKALTVASAIENKVVRPQTMYYCEKGKLKVDNHIIREADTTKQFEWLSVSDILKESSNIGTTKIAFDLGETKLVTDLIKYGIGERSGIDLPGESRGIFLKDQKMRQLSLSNLSFGQGVATTGIQMMSFYAALANGGKKVIPHLVKKDKIPGPTLLLKPTTAQEVTQMLIQAVESGTGKKAKIKHFTIAGKTGTAQKINSWGKYEDHIPSFIGYPVGVKKPFVVFVYLDAPTGKSYYGGTTAAPVFEKLCRHILFTNKEFALMNDNRNTKKIEEPLTLLSSAPQRGNSFIGLNRTMAHLKAKELGIHIEFNGIGIVHEEFWEQKNGLPKLILKLKIPKFE